VIKQEELIKLLDDNLTKVDVKKAEVLNEKITVLGAKFSKLEESLEDAVKIKKPGQNKSCKEYDETFPKHFELDTHIVNSHGHEKHNSCDICGKIFYLK
jgi:hypothetical protein